MEKASFTYIFGNICSYLSVISYTLARPDQIIKNYRKKHTHGLSPGMFLLTMVGNGTSLISLVSMSQERDYLIVKIPFILAATVPMICDGIILSQI